MVFTDRRKTRVLGPGARKRGKPKSGHARTPYEGASIPWAPRGESLLCQLDTYSHVLLMGSPCGSSLPWVLLEPFSCGPGVVPRRTAFRAFWHGLGTALGGLAKYSYAVRRARHAVRAVRILARDGRIPRPLRWLAIVGLLPIPGPFDEAILLLVAALLWAFYRETLTDAWWRARASA